MIFEAAGGSDKGIDGYRRDTAAAVEGLGAKGFAAEVVFYSSANDGKLAEGLTPATVAGCAALPSLHVVAH